MAGKRYEAELTKFTSDHNQVSDLLSPEELKRYHSLDFPDNVPILYDALVKKLEEDPDYEVWVPIRYFKYLLLNSVTGVKEFYTKFAFISNKGNVYHLRKQPKMDPNTANKEEYQTSLIKLTDGTIDFSIDRAVACSFIPLPDDLKAYGYYALEVRHKDDRSGNNDFLNLEWFAGNQNNQTVIDVPADNGNLPELLEINSRRKRNHKDDYAVKPILIEVLIPGPYYGVRFVRSSREELAELLGKDKGISAEVAAGHQLQVRGCRWSYATNDEIEQYGGFRIPEALKNMIRDYQTNWRDPILATRVEDGRIMLLDDDPQEMVSLGLDYSSVIQCCDRSKIGVQDVHKGYVFRRVDDEDELTKLKEMVSVQNKPQTSTEIPTVCFILGTREADGHLILLSTDKEIELLGWDKEAVHQATKKSSKPVYGFKFRKITDDLEVANLRQLIFTQLTVF